MHVRMLGALCASMVFAAASPAAAGDDEEEEGTTIVNVDLLTAPEDAPAAHQAALVGADGAEEPTAVLTSDGPRAPFVIRTADTLGPSYRVLSISLATGFGPLGTITEFAKKPKDRKKLAEGLRGEMDLQVDRVKVAVVLRGVGSGDFAWLNDYEYTLTAPCPVVMAAGETTELDIVIVRNAGPFADFGEGLAIECGG